MKQAPKELKRPADLIKWWNSLIRFYNNKIGHVLAREGKLRLSYFQEGLEEEAETLLGSIKTKKNIEDNIDRLLQIDYWLRDGYKGLQISGRYK